MANSLRPHYFALISFVAILLGITYKPLLFRLSGYHVDIIDEEPYFTFENIWTEKEVDDLIQFVKDQGEFKTASLDVTGRFDEIGESQFANAVQLENGALECNHNLLVPDPTSTKCIFPSRVDIAKHYIMSGGFSSRKEGYKKMVSRIQSFLGFKFNEKLQNNTVLNALFHDEEYVKQSKSVCFPQLSSTNSSTKEQRDDVKAENVVVDPFQLGIIISLPGQEVPVHYDAPWFMRYTRLEIPQWLLVAMASSGLFKDDLLPQVQGVAYLHRDLNEEKDGGEFFFYPDNSDQNLHTFKAKYNSALILNGCLMHHGVAPFLPQQRSDCPKEATRKTSLPNIEKSIRHSLLFDAQKNEWRLENDQGKVIEHYQTSDLRMSLVWRSRCFKDKQEYNKYHTMDRSDVTPQEVLEVFKQDLISKNLLTNSSAQTINPLDLGELILKTYILYPLNHESSIIPFNYCILPNLLITHEKLGFVRDGMETLLSFIGCQY